MYYLRLVWKNCIFLYIYTVYCCQIVITVHIYVIYFIFWCLLPAHVSIQFHQKIITHFHSFALLIIYICMMEVTRLTWNPAYNSRCWWCAAQNNIKHNTRNTHSLSLNTSITSLIQGGMRFYFIYFFFYILYIFCVHTPSQTYEKKITTEQKQKKNKNIIYEKLFWQKFPPHSNTCSHVICSHLSCVWYGWLLLLLWV